MTDTLKLVVVGGGAVGKSCVVMQYTKNVFLEEYDPTIEDSHRKQVTIDDISVVLDILDTAGQEDYRALRDTFLRSGQGFLLCYSIDNMGSFHEMTTIRNELLRICDTVDLPPVVLCGNKCDLEKERKISCEQGRELAKSFGCGFYECSALTRKNIDEIFTDVVRRIRKEKEKAMASNDKSKKFKLPKNCILI